MGIQSSKTNPKVKKPKKPKQSLNLLLLGIGGSGKSTFAKQMQILYNNGFDEDTLGQFKSIIESNIIVGMQEILKLIQKNDNRIEEANMKHSRYILSLPITATWDENSKIKEKISDLWNDRAVQSAYKKSSNHYLISHMGHWMNNLERIQNPAYTPNNEDILRARQRTTGVHNDITYIVERIEYRLIDMGGQQIERSKWEEVLKGRDIQAVLYFSALDDYNIQCVENNKISRLKVSAQEFNKVVNLKETKGISIILFLNKKDLFQKKMKSNRQYNDFKNEFPDYAGPKDWEKASKYLENYFNDIFESSNRTDDLFIHTTCALDTSAMKVVFSAVHSNIFSSRNLNQGIVV